jgi:dolichol-phosphate mannosyltransferase
MTVSVVLSVYDEEKNIPLIWDELKSVIHELSSNFELVWVNDGSKDASLSILQNIIAEKSSQIEHIIIDLSRNFGHEAAMIAGIDHCSGDVVICMDTDGQHPAQNIPRMIEAAENGFDIVNMARSKKSNSLKTSLFYRLLNFLSGQKFEENASDYFLISRRVIEILKTNYREHNRFLRGYIQSMGFNSVALEYDTPQRIHGQSKYSNKKLFKLAGIAIFSFSNKPLSIVIWVSLLFILFSLILGVYSLWVFFYGEKPPSGYTTQILFMAICFAILFLLLGIQSIYFSKSIEEIRSRPIYIVKDKIKQ